MDALSVSGRILFGLLFLASGALGHLASYQQSRGHAQSKGIPGAGPAVLLSGVVIIFAVNALGGEFGPAITDPLDL